MARRATRMKGKYEGETFYREGVAIQRTCTHCGRTIEIAQFHKNGVDNNGNPKYRDECKECYNAKRKENRVSSKHSAFVGHQKHRGEDNINYTFTEWREAVIFFGGRCAYCGRTMRKGEALTRDHLLPWSKGGKTEQVNIVPACTQCNCSKGNTEWREWYMKQPFFNQDNMNKIFQWRNIISLAHGGGSSE